MSKRARSDAGASVCADPIGALLSTVELARTKLEAMLTNQVDEIAGLKAQLTETAEACVFEFFFRLGQRKFLPPVLCASANT